MPLAFDSLIFSKPKKGTGWNQRRKLSFSANPQLTPTYLTLVAALYLEEPGSGQDSVFEEKSLSETEIKTS